MKFFNSVFYAATGLGVVGLLGCGSESVNYDGGEDSASSSQQAEYTPPEGGYLKEPFFTMGAQDSVIGWSFTQHSSDISYSVTAEDGVLSITRTGDEPWAKVRQFFKDDVDQVLGKKLKFSADVKADFTSEWGEAMEPPSLTVLVKGIRAGEPAILGKSVLLSKKQPINNILDVPYWHRYSVEFEMLSLSDAKALELEVGFLMTEGGTMYIRGPSLIEIESLENAAQETK